MNRDFEELMPHIGTSGSFIMDNTKPNRKTKAGDLQKIDFFVMRRYNKTLR